MAVARRVALALVAVTALAVPAAPAAGAARLTSFGSCDAFVNHARAQTARFISPWGFGGAPPPADVVSAAEPARMAAPEKDVDYSGTNVQEAGVDEPDMVKTDGTTVFTVSSGLLTAVDVGEGRLRRLDTLRLDDAGYDHQLLLHGDRLLVVSRGGGWIEPLPGRAAIMAPFQASGSVLTEVDVSNPAVLRVVRALSLDGQYVAARLVGERVRMVVSSQVPDPLPFEPPVDESEPALAAARAHNAAVVANAGAAAWLPAYRTARPKRAASADRPLVGCRKVYRPVSFSGMGMLSVLTIDLKQGIVPIDSVALMADASIVYASRTSLYVATERWNWRPDPDAPQSEGESQMATEIHRFDISDPARTRYRGSGKVSGFLLNQWSLSEHEGVLRVVSTETPAWWGAGRESESFLTTLRLGETALVTAGRVGELGKGERVYSARFVGEVGYVVTFRQVDPLYTLDLSDPAHPRVLGELKIPGYSAYLHPIGEDLLLGVGQDADENGRVSGTQISIFDVSDLRRPVRLHQQLLGPGVSEAEFDHHAFLHWPRTGLVVIPFGNQAIALRAGRARGLDEPTRLEGDGASAIRRSLVVGGRVLTVSDAGIAANNLVTLEAAGWAAFRTPPGR